MLRCTQLVKLNLSRTRITDNGEVNLQTYRSQHSPALLQAHRLFPTGLKFLKHMHLAHVNLEGTGVSLAGIADLMTSANISSIRASNTRTVPLDEVSDEEWETP